MDNLALRVLIVEDQLLIAKQVESIIASAGHISVGIAMGMKEACDIAITKNPDLAIVDLSLADGLTGPAVARYIVSHCNADVLFATANARRLPMDFCGAVGVIEKPFTRASLVSAVGYVAARITGAPVLGNMPASLHLSPAFDAIWRSPQDEIDPSSGADAAAARTSLGRNGTVPY